MSRRTYITKSELNKVMKYLKDNTLITEVENEVMTLRLLDIDIEEVSPSLMSKNHIYNIAWE